MTSSTTDAFSFSLAEFVWILFFLAMGGMTLLYTHSRSLQQEVLQLKEDKASLQAENMIIKARLEELEGGVIPCWKRPGSPVPELVGQIIIDSPRMIRIIPYRGREKSILLSGDDSGTQGFASLKAYLLKQYDSEKKYASENNCYLRIKVINHTERYSLFQETAAVLKSLNIVVVQE